MQSLYGNLCKAVADAINAASLAGDLARQVTAEHHWSLDEKLEEIDGVFVPVVFRANTSEKATRAADFETVQIDVGTLCKLGQNKAQEIDVLFQLIDQISGVLRAAKFTTVNAGWQSRATDPPFDVVMARERGLFWAATTHTYLVYRDVRI